MQRVPFFFVAAVAVCAACLPTIARAQTPPPAPEDAVPQARTGFQLALRTGYMVPFGQATGAPGDTMGNTFSGQVPLIVDIGGKLTPNVFLGGYLGLGFGGTAESSAQQSTSRSANTAR
jgi:hypothetical protein